MKKIIIGLLVVVVLAGLFFAGCVGGGSGGTTGGSGISDTDTGAVSTGINDVSSAMTTSRAQTTLTFPG